MSETLPPPETDEERYCEAASLLHRRRRARRSIAEYSMFIDVPGKPVSKADDEWQFKTIETSVAKHHVLIMSAVQEAAMTDNGRVMLVFPPGSAKSTYASVVAPTWLMGRFPNFRVGAASYATPLVRKHGRRARQIVRSSRFPGIFGTQLVRDVQAASEWALTNGSEFFGGGIRAGIGGHRFEFLLVDDPIKGREEADSQTIKTRVREEYEDVLVPRLVPGGGICMIMTRWAQDDLMGGILPIDWDGESGMIDCRDGLSWNVIRVPAIADRPDDPLGRKIGEGLWPEWFPTKHWIPFQRIRRTWNSLYQGLPRQTDAGFFKREWFKVVPPGECPTKFLKVVRRWDLAASEGEGDWTVGVLAGLDTERQVWILDVARFQKGPGSAEREMMRVTEKDDELFKGRMKVVFPREPGAAGKMLMRHFSIRFAKFSRGFHQETRAKHIRARPFADGLETGTVFLRQGPWNDTFIDELCAFDETIAEQHGDQVDDQVDAGAGAYYELVGRRIARAGAGPSAG